MSEERGEWETEREERRQWADLELR